MPHNNGHADELPSWLQRLSRKRWYQDMIGLVIASVVSCLGLIWLASGLQVRATSAGEIVVAFLTGSITTFIVTRAWDKVRSHG